MPDPNLPIVNAGELYINGLVVSNDSTTPDEIINISTGSCRDSSNANDIVVESSVAIDNTASGAGGLDTGSVAASTWYAVYILGDSTAYNDPAGIISTALPATGPAIPAGYDMFRHVGWVCTDATSDFLLFWQYGYGVDRWFYPDATIAVLSAGSSASFADVDCNATTPPAMPNLATRISMDLLYTPNAATDTADFRVNGGAATNGTIRIGSGVAGAQRLSSEMQTDSNATFEYKVTAGDTLTINLIGFQFSLNA